MLFQKLKRLNVIKSIYIVSALFLIFYFTEAQEVMNINSIARSITKHDLRKHLEIIAHDTLEGRETGKEGQRKAAIYLRSQFDRIGLEPVTINGEETFYQKFQLYRRKWGETSLTVNGKKYVNMEDILYLKNNPVILDKNIKVVFAGFGDKSDYHKSTDGIKGVVIINSGANENWEHKVDIAKKEGFDHIFVVYGNTDEDLREPIRLYSGFYHSSTLKFNRSTSDNDGSVFFIPPGLAEKIFNISIQDLISAADKNQRGKQKSIKKIPAGQIRLKVECFEESVDTENVIGFVQGSERPDEYVIISAHYDHVGVTEEGIYNGADDNGSGTTAVLELAEAFSIARKYGMNAKRSVVFILMTGEEKGLLGSRYYVQNPVFPLNSTIVNFNIDMIGRIDKHHVDDPDYVYLIGSDKISLELHNISEKTNEEKIGLKLDYTYNEESDPNRFYYRSDHYNFAKNEIPVIFYFTGVHNDYHKTTDVVDKILFDRMERITSLIFYTAWEVANMDQKLARE
jgi:hypothetical protein